MWVQGMLTAAQRESAQVRAAGGRECVQAVGLIRRRGGAGRALSESHLMRCVSAVVATCGAWRMMVGLVSFSPVFHIRAFPIWVVGGPAGPWRPRAVHGLRGGGLQKGWPQSGELIGANGQEGRRALAHASSHMVGGGGTGRPTQQPAHLPLRLVATPPRSPQPIPLHSSAPHLALPNSPAAPLQSTGSIARTHACHSKPGATPSAPPG